MSKKDFIIMLTKFSWFPAPGILTLRRELDLDLHMLLVIVKSSLPVEDVTIAKYFALTLISWLTKSRSRTTLIFYQSKHIWQTKFL